MPVSWHFKLHCLALDKTDVHLVVLTLNINVNFHNHSNTFLSLISDKVKSEDVAMETAEGVS